MEFKTHILIKESPRKLSHSSSVITMGSCFAEVIGQQLRDNKFISSVNPFGTIFNPLSIAYLLDRCISQSTLPDHSYLYSKEVWFNYYLHSSFYSHTKQALENDFIRASKDLYHQLTSCDFLILTLGTAYVYELNKYGHTVSNCHKQPSGLFTKRLLSVENIRDSLRQALKSAWKINPDIKVILTVSPVRHTKDSIQLNSVSKAILRLACHQLSESSPAIDYFPAFEILMDDLRDYRFYKDDLIHPNAMAEQYIWEKFIHSYCTPETLELLRQWRQVKKALNHIPFNSASKEHQQFLKTLLDQLSRLHQQIPCQEEIHAVQSQLLK